MIRITLLLTYLLLIHFSQSYSQIPSVFNFGNRANAYDVREMPSGNFILTGRVATNTSSNNDVFLMEIDSTGTVLGKTLLTGTDSQIGYFIIPQGQNKFYLLGRTDSYGPGNADIFLSLFEISAGHQFSELWSQAYGESSASGNFGGFENIYDVEVTAEGGLLIAGQTDAAFSTGGLGNADLYMFEVDSLGSVLWTYASGDNSFASEVIYDVALLDNGGYAILSHSVNASMLTVLDASRNLVFRRDYELDQSGYREVYEGIAVLPDTLSGYLVLLKIEGIYPLGAAPTPVRVLMMRLDSAGNKEWTRCYKIPLVTSGPSYDMERPAVISMPDNSILLGGTMRNDSTAWPSPLQNRPVLVNFDRNGNVLWGKEYPAFDARNLYQIHYSPSGKIIGAGWEATQSPNINDNPMFFSFSAAGNACWETTFTVDTVSHVFTEFALSGLAPNSGGRVNPFTFGTANSAITSANGCLAFSAEDAVPQILLEIWPNPAHEQLSLRMDEGVLEEIDIRNVEGRRIAHENMAARRTTEWSSSVADWPQGLYFIRAVTSKGTVTQKICVMHP